LATTQLARVALEAKPTARQPALTLGLAQAARGYTKVAVAQANTQSAASRHAPSTQRNAARRVRSRSRACTLSSRRLARGASASAPAALTTWRGATGRLALAPLTGTCPAAGCRPALSACCRSTQQHLGQAHTAHIGQAHITSTPPARRWTHLGHLAARPYQRTKLRQIGGRARHAQT